MAASVRERLDHIREAIANIRDLLADKSIESLRSEAVTRAAFERFIEIISEASRYIPFELKNRYPQITWIDIANIGNRLRHGYDIVDERVLWDIYDYELDALDQVINQMKGNL